MAQFQSGGGPDAKSLVLQATDLVALVGQTVSLKRNGRDFLGLCPFHSEKSPSFRVHPDKQFFYCFGCKAKGNAIDFVMQRDRIGFLDALKLLAEKANVDLPKFGISKEKAGEKQQLMDAHASAAMFFEKLLEHEKFGAAGRAYLEERGFTAETIKKFQIGLAVDSWDALLNSQAMKKYSPSLLALGGLLKARDSSRGGDGFYDTFRNRLMFPIRDDQGRTIAFGGRVMPGSQDPAKYLNSPQTPIFDKSRCVFGLDQAKKKIVETNPRTVAVVEGYTDVVMAHQFGATNVVSPLGTALTEQHVQLLRRFADRIVLLFDPDTAGDAAVNRAVELFLTQPIEIAIAQLPEDLDPDEYLLKYGLEAFEAVLNNAQDALTYKWKQLTKQFAAAGDLTGQQKAVQHYLETLASARGSGPVDSMRWASSLVRVSRLTEIPVDELNRRFSSRTSKPIKPAQATQANQPTLETRKDPVSLTAQDRAERQILGILLTEPHRWADVQHLIHVDDFSEAVRKDLADQLWMQIREEGEVEFNVFLSMLQNEATEQLAVELFEESRSISDLNATLKDAIAHVSEARQRTEQSRLANQMRGANDEAGEIDLLRQLQDKARRPDLRRVGK